MKKQKPHQQLNDLLKNIDKYKDDQYTLIKVCSHYALNLVEPSEVNKVIKKTGYTFNYSPDKSQVAIVCMKKCGIGVDVDVDNTNFLFLKKLLMLKEQDYKKRKSIPVSRSSAKEVVIFNEIMNRYISIFGQDTIAEALESMGYKITFDDVLINAMIIHGDDDFVEYLPLVPEPENAPVRYVYGYSTAKFSWWKLLYYPYTYANIAIERLHKFFKIKKPLINYLGKRYVTVDGIVSYLMCMFDGEKFLEDDEFIITEITAGIDIWKNNPTSLTRYLKAWGFDVEKTSTQYKLSLFSQDIGFSIPTNVDSHLGILVFYLNKLKRHIDFVDLDLLKRTNMSVIHLKLKLDSVLDTALKTDGEMLVKSTLNNLGCDYTVDQNNDSPKLLYWRGKD